MKITVTMQNDDVFQFSSTAPSLYDIPVSTIADAIIAVYGGSSFGSLYCIEARNDAEYYDGNYCQKINSTIGRREDDFCNGLEDDLFYEKVAEMAIANHYGGFTD
jgi:hypothetical protein